MGVARELRTIALRKSNMSKISLDIKKCKKIVSALVTVVLICSVFLCFSVVMQVLNRGYASIGGYSCFRVITGSMEPEIPVGALILSRKVDIDSLEVGDIVCFRATYSEIAGQSITHRVIGVTQDANGTTKLQTKGDYNVAADPYPVTDENLIGKVVWWSDRDNFFSDLIACFSNRVGFLAGIVFPCLVIAGFLFRNSVSNIKKELAKARTELQDVEQAAADDECVIAPSEQKTRDNGIMTNETPGAFTHDGQTQEQNKNQKDEKVLAGMDIREYQEMYARIRAELLEELKQEYDQEKTK